MPREVHQWNSNKEYMVKFLFDTPFEDEGKFGKYFSYGVMVNDEEKTIQASKTLNDLLESYRRDDVVYITKEVRDNKFAGWNIQINPKTTESDTVTDYVDTKRGEITESEVLSKRDQYEEDKWKIINWRNRKEIAWGQAMNLGVNTINQIDPQLAEKDTEKWVERSVAIASKIYPSLLKKEDELQQLYEKANALPF
tara:strand:+ start:897 stop:1484 length:588 start_codon:yes stop_codon:yes gene_type:complete